MINLNNCKPGDILICKHGVIKEYVKATPSGYYDHDIKIIYTPFRNQKTIEYRDEYDGFKELNGTVCNDGYVFRVKRLDTDSDVIKVIDREVFKRYLRMLSHKL